VTTSLAVGADGTFYFGAGNQLHAVGKPQLLDVQPSNDLTFLSTFLGDCATQPGAYTVRNAGRGTLNVSISVRPPFSVQPQTFSLGAGASQLVDVTFAPGTPDPFLDAIVFNSDDGTDLRAAQGVGVLPTVGIQTGKGETNENEPDKPASFTLQRSGGLGSPLTVQYSTKGAAEKGVDYEKLPGSVTFPKGQATVSIPVVPIDNLLADGDRTVAVELKRAPAHVIDPSRQGATAAILDDEPVVGITATDPIASAAGPNTAAFEVTRRTASPAGLIVTYQLAGTAKLGKHYEVIPAPAGSVTIPPGATSAQITVAPLSNPGQRDTLRLIAVLKAARSHSVNPAARSAFILLLAE
jgi:hypothetical protein